jgi:hypothetical protein
MWRCPFFCHAHNWPGSSRDGRIWFVKWSNDNYRSCCSYGETAGNAGDCDINILYWYSYCSASRRGLGAILNLEMVYVPYINMACNCINLLGFYLNLPFGGVVALFLLLIKVPDRIDRTNNATRLTILGLAKKLDIAGFLIFAPATVMLLMALQWGGTEHPWNSATIIGLFCGAGASLIPFVIWEYYVGDNAMIPVSVIRHRVVWSSCIYGAFFLGAVMTFTYYMPIYFQAVRGVSPSLSGVYLFPSILSQMIAAVLSGVMDEFGNRC